MFYQIFLPPQVKRCAIITWKYGIFDYRLNLSILENIRKFFFDQEKQNTKTKNNETFTNNRKR